MQFGMFKESGYIELLTNMNQLMTISSVTPHENHLATAIVTSKEIPDIYLDGKKVTDITAQ
jgi:hypothetical protein